MALAEEQIKAAFDQSEKEVLDLLSRISQGLREAKKNGSQIGLPKGTTLETKKSIFVRALLKSTLKTLVVALKILWLSNFAAALETLIINIKRKQSQIKENVMEKVKIGDTIKIIKMEGEPQYKADFAQRCC